MRRLGRSWTCCSCLILGLLVAPSVSAESVGGVEFSPLAKTSGGELRLCSTALLRYLTVFRGYSAGLYLDDCAVPSRAVGDVPKRLELSYFWSISGEQFADAADELLVGSLDEMEIAKLRPRIDALHRHYRAVEPGDRYRLTYLPGIGTELALNGEPLVVIEGADFASAYFGIWLGEKPIDTAFRDKLLGTAQ